MKKVFIILLLVVFYITAGAKTYAIVTGVSNYDGEDHDLSQSTKDAKAIAKLYTDRGAAVTILTSKYASHDNILAIVRKIAKVSTSNDDIVFFYSGHGAPNCIYTYDGNNIPPIMYSELFSELNNCRCRNITVFIDACFSGTAASSVKSKGFDSEDSNWKSLVKSSGKYILMLSSRQDEASGENGLVGAGFFTRALLKGLHGKCDENSDKKITVMELFKYVYGDVVMHSSKKQHPQLVTSKSLYDHVVMDWSN